MLQGGISTLNTHFKKEYAQALEDLAAAEVRLKQKLESMYSVPICSQMNECTFNLLST